MNSVWAFCGYMVMAGLIAWGLVRGLQTGVLADEHHRYGRDAQPLRFAVDGVARIAALLFCVAGMGHALGLNGDPILGLRKLLVL